MTTIKANPLSGDFNEALFNFLKTPGVEGYKNFIYIIEGIPTLGVGYAGMVIKKSDGTFVVRDDPKYGSYKTDFANAGINLSDARMKTLGDDLTAAAKALNKVPGATNPFSATSNILDWTITLDRAKALAIAQFDEEKFGHALNRVKKWLGDNKWAGDAETIYNRLKDSKEMLVIADLAYNNFIKADGSGCSSLKNAILSGNRAEAWYEIRYNTGGSLQRRIAEAGIFGLYNDPANVTKEDATMIYQMFTKNRGTMLDFEATNITAIHGGQTILASNAGLGAVQPLKDELQSAANVLMNAYQEYLKDAAGNNRTFDPLNIQESIQDGVGPS